MADSDDRKPGKSRKKDQARRNQSLLGQFTEITGQVTGSALDLMKTATSLTAMEGGKLIKDNYFKSLDPDRLQAMAEAGRFLHDAREVAGLTVAEVSESLGLSDSSLIEDVESGEKVLSLEMMLRLASLIARHDPIPFLIKFMRTYNPRLGESMEQWGLTALPKNFERERRFINIYRQHDILRSLTDAEFDRLIGYTNDQVGFTLEIMAKEKAVNQPAKDAKTEKASSRGRRRPRRGS